MYLLWKLFVRLEMVVSSTIHFYELYQEMSCIRDGRTKDIFAKQISKKNEYCLYDDHTWNCNIKHNTNLSFEEQLITGKNIPSRLKFRKLPRIGTPLKVKVIIGTVKSSPHPMTSFFLIYGSTGLSTTCVLRPPDQRKQPSNPNEYKSSPTPFPPHFSPPPG